MRQFFDLPFVVILIGIGALAMYLPALHAFALRDWLTARSFLYSATLFTVLAALVGIASVNARSGNQARSHLLAMLGAYVALPVMLAVPFHEAVRNTTFLNAYFEMVSSLTTTGATLFEPGRLTPSVHLWRALVGWLGGFFLWITAIAILAPMNLGGFEVTAADRAVGQTPRAEGDLRQSANPRERLVRFSGQLLPVYAGLTGGLWICLLIAGEGPFVAICHAMSTMATSGITPVGGGVAGGQGGLLGEILIFLFFLFALSRQTFMLDFRPEGWRRLRRDIEFRFGLTIAFLVPVFLFARHWLGAYEVASQENLFAALSAFWGSVFTVLSYLTTTGFVSADWGAAQQWSGLDSPGLILAGLAVFGGGVATTAGGVKLLRIYALYKHGMREMEKLVHPSSVGGAGAFARRIRRQGAQIAFVFFMLFALSVAVVMVALSLTGQDFDSAMILTVAALTTTGPLAATAGEVGVAYATLGDGAKLILAAAMVLGRLETLAIIALLNPEFWST